MHFDTPFSGLSSRAKAEIRREDLRETFLHIINIADSENVDMLLIAGDLFDSESVTNQTINFILEALKKISHIPVFIAPGNHDPFTPSSYYSSVVWPENVYIFGDNITYIEIPSKNVRIYGAGFMTAIVRQNILEGFKAIDDGFINILLMHGDIYPTPRPSDYNPVTELSISESGLNYAAFGHRHEFSGILKTGNTYYSCCGSPEGRGFDELGEKGIVTGYVYKKSCNLKFIRTCKRVYKECHVNVKDCLTYDQLCNMILSKVTSDNIVAAKNKVASDNKVASNSMQTDLYKIIVSGTFGIDFTPSSEVVLSKLRENMFFCKLEINSLPLIDIEQLKSEYSLKGIFVKKMLGRIDKENSDRDKDIIKKALYLGIDAFDKKGVTFNDN